MEEFSLGLRIKIVLLYYKPYKLIQSLMKNITIYSTATCHFCKLAKEFMTTNNIPFIEYNVGTDLERRKEMVEKSGQMGVPVIDVGGKILVGFEEGEFKEALGI